MRSFCQRCNLCPSYDAQRDLAKRQHALIVLLMKILPEGIGQKLPMCGFPGCSYILLVLLFAELRSSMVLHERLIISTWIILITCPDDNCQLIQSPMYMRIALSSSAAHHRPAAFCMQEAALQPTAVQGLSMHGTGTPLGDPIEVGAATAVLCAAAHSRQQPLALEASKSHQGHAEPAAGLVGLLHATHAMTHGLGHAIMHLRSPNPFLTAALQSGPCRVGRQQSPSGHASEAACMGISAFAFQVGLVENLGLHCWTVHAKPWCS